MRTTLRGAGLGHSTTARSGRSVRVCQQRAGVRQRRQDLQQPVPAAGRQPPLREASPAAGHRPAARRLRPRYGPCPALPCTPGWLPTLSNPVRLVCREGMSRGSEALYGVLGIQSVEQRLDWGGCVSWASSGRISEPSIWSFRATPSRCFARFGFAPGDRGVRHPSGESRLAQGSWHVDTHGFRTIRTNVCSLSFLLLLCCSFSSCYYPGSIFLVDSLRENFHFGKMGRETGSAQFIPHFSYLAS